MGIGEDVMRMTTLQRPWSKSNGPLLPKKDHGRGAGLHLIKRADMLCAVRTVILSIQK